MRIRIPGRFIAALAFLAVFLCLLPVSTNVAVARPIGWDDMGPPPPPSEGDNDGVVLKSASLRSYTGYAKETTGRTTANVSTQGRYVLSGVRWYFAATRLDYWLFWVR